MRFCRVLFLLLVLAGSLAPGWPAAALAQPQPSPDEFVPMGDVPPQEQIPAFPLVGAAYGFVWVAVVAYVWSLGRRLQKAETELADLERRSR